MERQRLFDTALCWDVRGILVFVIAIPIVLYHWHLVNIYGYGSYELFSNPLMVTSLMYGIFSVWYWGMYPVDCIKKTLIPKIRSAEGLDASIIDQYIAFLGRRRNVLLLWGLLLIPIVYIPWPMIVPFAWSVGISQGIQEISWLFMLAELLFYLISLVLTGEILNKILIGSLGDEFQPIIAAEQQWMDEYKMDQSA